MHAFSWNKFRYIGDYLHDVAVVFFLCCLNAKSLNWGTAKDIYIYIYIFTCTCCLYNVLYLYSVHIFDLLYIYIVYYCPKVPWKGLPLQRPFVFFLRWWKHVFPRQGEENHVLSNSLSRKHACPERKNGHGQTLTPVLSLPLHMLWTGQWILYCNLCRGERGPSLES